MNVLRTILRYAALLLALLFLGVSLLYLAGLTPQERVAGNLLDSAYQLNTENAYPHVLDSQSWSQMVDMASESYILNLSYYMNTQEDPSSILVNPNICGAIGEELQNAVEEQAPANESYARYWGGFRVPARLLLTFFTYTDIRRILALAVFLLSGGTALFLYKKTNTLAAPLSLLFVIAVLKPFVISSAMQFSCCFILAMLGILLLPRKERRFLTYPVYFFIIGAATQYFDFYTTPALTFGLPMLSLLAIRQSAGGSSVKKELKLIGMCFAAWFAAYLLMWLGKLALTTLFTDLNEFSNGFSAIAYRLLDTTDVDVTGSLPYRICVLLWRVFIRVFERPAFIAAFFGTTLLLWLYFLLRSGSRKERFLSGLPYLLVACLPILWFIAASEPSLKHSWFQYRNVGVFLFGLLLFVFQTRKKSVPPLNK